GMRQAGILAAACVHALEHHVERLAEDHANAQILAEAFEEAEGFELAAASVETNILWVPVDPSLGTAQEIAQRFAEHGMLVLAHGPQLIRMCTHLDIARADCLRAA